jgi:TPR repeat
MTRLGIRLLIGALLALVSTAAAQTPIRQDGRLFDANPSITGGRLNDSRLYSPMLGGNAAATGNLRFGQSLRVASPLGDPSSFRGSLGSSTLSSFVRDSFSGFDASRAALGGGPVTYYDPAGTAPTASYLRGQGDYGYTGLAARSAQETRLGVRRAGGGVGPIDARLLPAAQNTGLSLSQASAQANFATSLVRNENAGLGSSIFGPRRPLPGPASFDVSPPSARDPGGRWYDADVLPARSDIVPGRVDSRLDVRQKPTPTATPSNTRLDAITQGDASSILAQRETRIAFERPASSGLIPSSELAKVPAKSGAPSRVGGAAEKSALPPPPLHRPGADVFSDMQLSVNYAENPNADWIRDMLRGRAEGAQREQGIEQAEGERFIANMTRAPLKSFVGSDATAFNDEMLKAESLLEIGQFPEAAARYQQAAVLDPTNPLPRMGRGHALLGAGEYASAAGELVRAFERYPEMVKFRVDLRRFLGGEEMVDIRRADILRQLEGNDDPRLHFLLGYIEVNSGNRERGLQALDRAGRSREAGSFLRRYADLIRGTAVPPPPKLPDGPGSVPKE